MTVLAVPPIIDPDNVELWPWANTLTSVSPLTRDQQTVALPGVLWRCHFDWPSLEEADWRQVAAWLASLQGASGRFNVPVPHARMPQGQGVPNEFTFTDGTGFDDGTRFFDPPYVVKIRSDVSSTKLLFRSAGWAHSTTALRKGDYVSWSNRSRRMMAIMAKDAKSDSSGQADLALAFPAPEIPPAGRRLYPWWPSVTMRMNDDEQAQQAFRNYRIAQQGFDATEAAP